MRIALVHSFYQSGMPSGENAAVTLQAQALADAGHDVRIIGRNTDDYLRDKIYPVKVAFTVATGKGASPLAQIEAFSPDVIHIHNLFPNWSTDWLNKLDIPFVVTLHNFRLICPVGTLLRDGQFCDLCPRKGAHHSVIHSCYRGSKIATIPLALSVASKKRPEILEKASRIIFLSPRSQVNFANYGLGYENKATIIPHFVPSSFSEIENPVQLANEARWLFVGRLSTEKGILGLIEGWPKNQPLDVVGTGPLLEKCREAARIKDIDFYGQQPPDTVSRLLRNSRGLIFPSLCQETLSFVYLEALSVGCPVVALAGNTVADDLEESRAGTVFAEFSKIQDALSDLESGQDFYGRKARERFEERFSTNKWLESMTIVYSESLKKHDV